MHIMVQPSTYFKLLESMWYMHVHTQYIPHDFITLWYIHVHTGYILVNAYYIRLSLVYTRSDNVHTLYILVHTDIFVSAENMCVLDGQTEIFPPEIPDNAELVPHNQLLAPPFQCSHWLPGYAAFADHPRQEPHHSLALGYEIPSPQVD